MTTFPNLREVPLVLRPLCRGPWRVRIGTTQHCCWRRTTATRVAATWQTAYPDRTVRVRRVGSRREVQP